MAKRDADAATAGASVVYYERWRETGDDELLAKIHEYNRTDCISTQLLRDWLVSSVRPVDMPWPSLGNIAAAGPLANVKEEDDELEALRERIAPVRDRLGGDVAELLVDLSGFYRREVRPSWWAIFDRLAQESEALVDDLECIQGLESVGPPVSVTARSFERTYRFPRQETKLRAGKRPCVKPAAMPEDVDLRAIDHRNSLLVLRRSTAKGPLPDRLDLLPPKPIRNDTLRDAVSAVIDAIIAGGDPATLPIEHLLSRDRPVFVDGLRETIVDPHGDLAVETSSAIGAMAGSTLAIQGPPGSGKTFVSALSIVELVRSGRRVAVSSNSHKAISNLLTAVADRARAEGVRCRIVQKAADDGNDDAHPGIALVSGNDASEIATAGVVGATAWHFARYDVAAFDHLFIDEAGQVSLANVVAMSRSARNLVLVGDPMQLPQPVQGTHPGSSGMSCLEYLIGDNRVVPPDRGVFMPVSRRMHPDVCRYISDVVYDSRLANDTAAGAQRLVGRDGVSLVGAGVQLVEHFGRSQVCPEEITAIRERIDRLAGSTYRNRDGAERLLTHADILVVAPYNAQVNALREALPRSIAVGTVDRFQGQEAPVCLVSMTTSSSEELPRDIAFLFSLNRINVAVSRAQVSATVFASPLLLETPCRTIDEMMLVNALCVLREHGGDGF